MLRGSDSDECGYCPLNHIAQALHFDRWREIGFLVASTVYGDMSGNDHDAHVCLVAGWHNSVANWTEFGVEWKAFLADEGITYLHQTKSRHNPANDEWKKDPANRLKVNRRAVALLRQSGAISVAFCTPTADYNEFMADAAEEGFDKADCFAWNATRFVAHVDDWRQARRVRMPEFVMESCTKKEQDALDAAMKEYDLPKPIYRDKQEIDPDRVVVALQAADLLAYELFRMWRERLAGRPVDRPIFEELDDMPGRSWGWADRALMNSLRSVSKAQLRLEAIAQEREGVSRDDGQKSER